MNVTTTAWLLIMAAGGAFCGWVELRQRHRDQRQVDYGEVGIAFFIGAFATFWVVAILGFIALGAAQLAFGWERS
jgi:hypothetical protein